MPVDLLGELKLFKTYYGEMFSTEKDEYGNISPVHVTFEQMFRRWIEIVKKTDKEVYKKVKEAIKCQARRPVVTVYPVDPTEGDLSLNT